MQNRSDFVRTIELLSKRLDPDFPIILTRYEHHNWGPAQLLHIHDCMEIGLCRSGSGILFVEDKVLPFAAGDALVVSERETHGFRRAEGESSEWEFLTVSPVQLIGTDGGEPRFLSTAPLCGPHFNNIFKADKAPAIVGTIRDMIGEMRAKPSGYRAAVRSLLWALMVRLHRLTGQGRDSALPGADRRLKFERIAPALDHIAQHYAEPVRIRELCRICHASPSTLQRQFVETVGVPPSEHVARLRVRMAAALLQSTGRKVLDIALSVGYPTLSSFHRQFGRIMGVSPTAWRKGKK